MEKLSRSPARFDTSQLLYWQKMAVQALTIEELWRWLGESILNQVPEKMHQLFAETIQTNIVFPKDATIWAKVFFHEFPEIDQSGLEVIKEAGEQFFVEAEQAVDKYGIDFSRVLSDMKQSLGINGKKLFMPLRFALTGMMHGPELAQIALILGEKKLKHRLGRAFKLATQNQG